MFHSTQPSNLEEYLETITEVERALMGLFHKDARLTIFDIGACEGEDSIRYARRFPEARIFAFEPLPINQEFISANLLKHGVSSVELVPKALSKTIGKATFHVSSGVPKHRFSGECWNYGNRSSSLLPPASNKAMYGWIEFPHAIEVQTTTLESFCEERNIGRIDFVHMDVQGAELMVLQGAREKLKEVSAIWLEVANTELYQGQPLKNKVEEFMRTQNFVLVFEQSNADEGDQFYVNRRHTSVWRWFVGIRIKQFLRKCRFNAGRWKNTFKQPQ